MDDSIGNAVSVSFLSAASQLGSRPAPRSNRGFMFADTKVSIDTLVRWPRVALSGLITTVGQDHCRVTEWVLIRRRLVSHTSFIQMKRRRSQNMGKYTEFETRTQPWFDESNFKGSNFAIPMKTPVISCVDPRASDRPGPTRF